MIVKFNGNGLRIIPLKAVGATAKERVQMSGAEHVFLTPGANEVHDGDWAIAEIHIKQDMLNGVIEVIGIQESIKRKFDKNRERVAIKTKGIAFKDLESDDAISVVKECLNLMTLETWAETESRDSVRAAIFQQTDYIHAELKKGKVAGGGDNSEVLSGNKKKDTKKTKTSAFNRLSKKSFEVENSDVEAGE